MDLTMRALRAATLLLVLAGAAALPSPARAQDPVEVGSRAPGALVETLEGKPFDLGTVVGKGPVVMEFWATWCGNCKALEPHLRAMQAKYAKQVRFVTVAVSVNQSAERVRLHQQKHRMPGDLYYDRKGNATGAYDVPATSYVVVVDRKGTVVYTGLGGDQQLEAAIRKAM
jgi:thiol-disulfide isomerase/thioredoxin